MVFIFIYFDKTPLFFINIGQSSLSNVCLMTFDNALYRSDPSYPNARFDSFFSMKK